MQKMMKLISGGLVAGLILFGAGCGNGGEGKPSGTLVSISARGEASKVPDVADISAGVVTEAAESQRAMQANAEQMEKLIKAIEKTGIDKKDVQTSGISLTPRYTSRPNSEGPNRQITGYMARNTVRITVREIDDLGNVLDSMAEAGANNIYGPSFSIGEPEPLLAEARGKALEQARERAASYAESLGMKVARIVSISEGGNVGAPRPMMRAEMASADARTPVAPGETTVSVNLELVFELQN
ncbi:SIMPL domain-containing protein [Microbulbifer sediminum]|uniref:SIMPL domain-containing protein n=1 Tax=Microbulbifer sediminum TaxID=2904250 RepID=UPI001F2D6741|nr:SIMPL domain-containing protein [Microbulbifer sediminum]